MGSPILQPLTTRSQPTPAPPVVALLLGALPTFIVLVGLLGYSFLSASVTAKIVNLGTNVAAIIVFGLGGYIWWQGALVMAVFNVVGAVIGARMALRRGSGFVRVVFLVIVAVLIVRLIVGW